MTNLFYRYNPWWDDDTTFPNLFPRKIISTKLLKMLKSDQIIFLTGLRRVGKTSIMKLLIQELITNSKVEPRDILYVSLDDYLLSKLSILDIVDEYRNILKIGVDRFVYLFLDEITYKDNYELQLKNLYDSHNVKVVSSSSSASLLKERKYHLTGRHSTLEIQPLNFDEYLLFKGISLKKRDNNLLAGYFEDFLETGGIPQYVLKNDLGYIKDLVDDIIQKDISSKYNIKNDIVLKDMFLLLMERSGKVFSINKIANILKISPDSARRYVELFRETYLIHLMEREGKTNERILSAKKIYACDVGVRSLFTGFRDKGSLFENYVYLAIKHLNPRYFYEKGIELDFIIKNKMLIEVKYDSIMNEKQKQLFDKIKIKNKHEINNIFQLLEFEKKLPARL